MTAPGGVVPDGTGMITPEQLNELRELSQHQAEHTVVKVAIMPEIGMVLFELASKVGIVDLRPTRVFVPISNIAVLVGALLQQGVIK